jgi:ubiquinol-cytochrome c reductase cytochrome b subunit
MLNQYFKKNPLFGIFHSTLVGIPAPSSLSLIWNFGSLLSLCLIVQLVSGIILATSYLPYIDIRFSRIALAMESRDSLWLFRYIHANGASLFFVCLYIHVARGIFCGSYLFTHTWNIGVTILLITMAAAFLGYVLPSNQISF